MDYETTFLFFIVNKYFYNDQLVYMYFYNKILHEDSNLLLFKCFLFSKTKKNKIIKNKKRLKSKMSTFLYRSLVLRNKYSNKI